MDSGYCKLSQVFAGESPTAGYGEVVPSGAQAVTAVGRLEKSILSEHFIAASRGKLRALMERRLDEKKFCALLTAATLREVLPRRRVPQPR